MVSEAENEKNNYWSGKKAKIEVLRDGRKLFFTAEILSEDENLITFMDREGCVYSFNKKEILEIKGVVR